MLPANIFPGDILHVQTPESNLYEITVPQGAGPFSRLIVRISPSLPTSTMNPSYNVNTNYAQPSVPVVAASVPGGGAIPVVHASTPNNVESDIYYPSQQSKPVVPSVYVPS
jgi:hypothetical protein